MITFTVLTGPDAGHVFTFESDSVVIGRSIGCDIMLHDASLGRRHCEIRQEKGNVVLADLGSVNGTFLNDQEGRITTHSLRSHDEIRLGRSRLRVEFPEPEEQRLPPSPPPVPPPPSVEVKPPPPERPVGKAPPSSPPPPVTERPKAPAPPSSPSLPTEEATVVGAPSPPSPSPLVLRVIEGADIGRTFEPKPEAPSFTVGRGQTADFTLKDLRVSRIHFTIEQTPTTVTLIDEGSLNGTFVNDNPERVKRTTLRHGDIISISDTRLQIDIPSQGESTSFAPLPPRALPPTRHPHKEREARGSPQTPVPSVSTPITVSLPSRWQAVFIALFLTALCSGGMFVLGKPTLFSSGPLSTRHTSVEGECTTCHSPWGTQAMSTSCAVKGCHANIVHTNTQHQDDCTMCHTEHRGPTFNIKGEATQCWRCHETTFQERPLWRHYKHVFVATGNKEKRTVRLVLPTTEAERLRWQQSAPYDESGLIFAHAAHAKSSGLTECRACHEPLPGTVINALSADSAFPSHSDCIDCHKEVGNRDPQLATATVSAQCRKCHTREDNKVMRLPRTLLYVEFSHDNHKTTDCVQCHFTINGEQTYRPVLRSRAYLLPMEACVSCHEQQRAATSCLSCHRAHHSVIQTARTDGGFLARINLRNALLALLVLESGIAASVYWWRRET